MAAPQQFSLRWNNYSQHIVTALEDLRSDDEFTDVTLSCDGERLKAHKILLAACSTYFRDTFLENPCKHPVIILKGVTFSDLEAVVKFMYNGQVNVSQDRLPSFLQTAELLQIKGLTDMNDKEDNSKKRSNTGNGSSLNSQNQPSNLDSNSTRSATPDVPTRPPTPKRKRVIGGYQNDGASSSGNASFSSSSTMPTQPVVIGNNSNGAMASTSSGGLLNPQSVVIPSASSTSSNVPNQQEEDGGFHNVSIVKFEDDDIQDDEFDEKHMSSEDNDNSAQDMLCSVEPSSIGVFSGSGPSGMNASGAESTSHGKVVKNVEEVDDEDDDDEDDDESDWTPPLQPLHPSQFQLPEIINHFSPGQLSSMRNNNTTTTTAPIASMSLESNIIISNITSGGQQPMISSNPNRIVETARRRSLPQIVKTESMSNRPSGGSLSSPINIDEFASKFIGFNPNSDEDENSSSNSNNLGESGNTNSNPQQATAAGTGTSGIDNRCDICGKTFTLKTNLTAHKRRHTGETECPFCDKVLSTVGNLRSHVMYVHNGCPVPARRAYKSSGVYYNKNIRAALELLDAEMIEGEPPIHIVQPPQ